MKYRIDLETRTAFAEAVREHHCELRLAPLENELQKLVALKIFTDPKSDAHSYRDCFGNRVDCLDVTPPHESLLIRIGAEVETLLANPFDYKVVPAGSERAWIEQQLSRDPRLLDYVLHRSDWVPDPDAAATLLAGAPAWDGRSQLLEAVTAARDWVTEKLEVDPEAGPVRPPLADVLKTGKGDCRDLAHALIALIRAWGVPARYVTGYEEVAGEEEDRAPERAAPHAWTEILIPGAGWRGFDPTFSLVVNDHYVAVAVGRDASDTPPVKQVFKGESSGEQELKLQFSRGDQ